MLEVDKNTFQAEVLEAEGYVFVDFFGDGCVPCRERTFLDFTDDEAIIGEIIGDKEFFLSHITTTKVPIIVFKFIILFLIIVISIHYQ